jgi:hypothetical protein
VTIEYCKFVVAGKMVFTAQLRFYFLSKKERRKEKKKEDVL